MSNSSTRSTSTGAGRSDPHNLSRFLAAQSQQQTYLRALREIRAGQKRSHWMWFIFPQLDGLAEFPSRMAKHYAISGMAEAEAYLAHPVLGGRLRVISRAALDSRSRSVEDLMGSEVDVDKLRSSMTLFKRVVDGKKAGQKGGEEEGDNVFEGVLGRWFGGAEDQKTVEGLRESRMGNAEQ